MFIKREPTPYKEHEVNTPYSTYNFREPTPYKEHEVNTPYSTYNFIIMVYEALIKVDIYGVGLANTRAQL
jgi:hypothetical protein